MMSDKENEEEELETARIRIDRENKDIAKQSEGVTAENSVLRL